MKALMIGAGGIGSVLTEKIHKQIEKGQLEIDLTVADDDMVEVKNIQWQNFGITDIGQNKAKVLAKRYEFEPWDHRVLRPNHLDGFELIILCVDNIKTRRFVIDYCYDEHIDFIDLRATGRRVFAMPKLTKEENMRFVDQDDGEEHSCQDKADLEKGWVQTGNEIVAAIGMQMLLNYSRGHSNITISMSI